MANKAYISLIGSIDFLTCNILMFSIYQQFDLGINNSWQLKFCLRSMFPGSIYANRHYTDIFFKVYLKTNNSVLLYDSDPKGLAKSRYRLILPLLFSSSQENNKLYGINNSKLILHLSTHLWIIWCIKRSFLESQVQ